MKHLALLLLYSILMTNPSCSSKQPQIVAQETEQEKEFVIEDTILPVVIDYGLPDTVYASRQPHT